MDFILADSAVFWIVCSIIFAIVELFIFSGVGFLYASISSIITAFLIYANVIASDAIFIQIMLVFITSVAVPLIWIKLFKNFIVKNDEANLSNIIGTQAIVVNDGITKGAFGCVKWSGQVMTAKLDNDVYDDYIGEGTLVRILSINGTILTVKPIHHLDPKENLESDSSNINENYNLESEDNRENNNLDENKEKSKKLKKKLENV